MKYLLDTNVVISLMKGHPLVLESFRRRHIVDIGLPTLVEHELYFGAYRARLAALNIARLDAFRLPVVDFTSDDARRAGEVRAILAAAGTPIDPYDVLIAGQALARDLILVTHNTREFQRLAGLRIEDWQI